MSEVTYDSVKTLLDEFLQLSPRNVRALLYRNDSPLKRQKVHVDPWGRLVFEEEKRRPLLSCTRYRVEFVSAKTSPEILRIAQVCLERKLHERGTSQPKEKP